MKKIVILTVLLGAFFSGCAVSNTEGGTAIGATTGALIGSMVGNHRDAMIGAAGGAVAGALIGKSLDDEERRIREENYR